MNASPSQPKARPRARAWPLLALLALLPIGYAAWPTAAATPEPSAQAVAAVSARPLVIDESAPVGEPPVRRREVLEPVQAPTRNFDDYVEELVEIGARTSRLVIDGDIEGADASDAKAKELFAELMQNLADAPSEALARLLDHPTATEDCPAHDHLRRRIWNLVLATGLQNLHRTSLQTQERESLDALVAATLVSMPQAEPLAHELCVQLDQKPYLGLAHEPIVLEFVAASGVDEFPAEVARKLLSTLWDNLQKTGQRTSEELNGLALLLLRDGNASERASAAELLLADPRYRLVVLEHLRRSEDHKLAREVAMVAARILEPQVALQVLSETAGLAGDFLAPYLVLGYREPALLQREYELQLANDTSPEFRGELVRGVGFSKDPLGVATAQLAFQSDPHPDVRLKAVFVLTANAAKTLAEPAFHAALQDPAIRDNPVRLGALVLALENLANAGEINAVDRIGRQLLAAGALNQHSRTSLEELLARTLPRGGR